ncbi:MAG: S1C family serine protease [Eubacteriales bacterium]|nr:S1C family serine protease [Eubacteriales bacterium]
MYVRQRVISWILTFFFFANAGLPLQQSFEQLEQYFGLSLNEEYKKSVDRVEQSLYTLELVQTSARGFNRIRTSATALAIDSKGLFICLYSAIKMGFISGDTLRHRVQLQIYDPLAKKNQIVDLVTYDLESDLALLKSKEPMECTAIDLAENRPAELGEEFIHLTTANPFTARAQRHYGVIDLLLPPLISETGLRNSYFSSDILINKTQLFGPVIAKSDGQLLGFSIYRQNRNATDRRAYFTEVTDLQAALERLKEQVEKHAFEQNYVGIAFYQDEYYQQLVSRYELPQGLMIAELHSQSPAYVAGLNEQEIIVEANGQKIKSAIQFVELLEKLNPGDLLELEVMDENGNFKNYQIYIKGR